MSWFVSAQILTIDITKLPQGESLVHLLLTADLASKKVSIHRNEQNGQGYIKSHEEKLCQPRSVHGVSVM